jgi:hypothetical protein
LRSRRADRANDDFSYFERQCLEGTYLFLNLESAIAVRLGQHEPAEETDRCVESHSRAKLPYVGFDEHRSVAIAAEFDWSIDAFATATPSV